LSLTFGLVSIPVKLYSATQSSAAIRFKLMGRGGVRLRQQYVADPDQGTVEPDEDEDEVPQADASRVESSATSRPARTAAEPPRLKLVDDDEDESEPVPPGVPGPALVERAEMVKGYEFEKGRFVIFTPDELKALQSASRQTIDIVSFIPERSVDPVYYDNAYFLAPDRRAAKTYSLLLAAMRKSGRCALAKWAFRAKEYAVEIRAAQGGLVLQQLLYADEVRSLGDLGIDLVEVGEAELKLALQLIAQISEEAYDPGAFVDEEKQRILAAVEEKIAGRRIVAHGAAPAVSAQVVDLMAALRASLRAGIPKPVSARASTTGAAPAPSPADAPVARKAARRGVRSAPVPAAAAPVRSRAKK
jgi:DNA end-binding protein Ku